MLRLISLFLLSVTISSGAAAQVFAPGSAPVAQKSSSSPLSAAGTSSAQISNNADEEDDFNEEDFEDEDFDKEDDESGYKSDFFTDSVKDFDNEDNNKAYDNKVGKVIDFHFIKDQVVLSDNADRKILVYYDDYKLDKGLDNIVRCSMRIYVLNDLEEKISDLSFKLKWKKVSTNIQMNHLNPGVRTYSDIMLLGDGCYNMDKVPTIEINRCRVKGKTQEQCADAVKWFNLR